MDTDEQHLVHQVALGDQLAMAQLYAIYRPRLWRYLWHQMPGRTSEVDDVLQEIFLGVWRSAVTYRGQAKVSTWIFQIAHNQVVRHRAQDPFAWQAERDDDDEPTSVSLEDEVAARIDIDNALAHLSPKHREVLQLIVVHGFSTEEVAVILHIPGGTVKSRISYARRALFRDVFLIPEKDQLP